MSRAAFSTARDGDLRSDVEARSEFATSLGIPSEWATVSQVHGGNVIEVAAPGDAGAADALFTLQPHLPVAVFTADCLAVALLAQHGAGMAHAGWRGLREGVIEGLRERMGAAGAVPTRAVIGPGIGPCCFEVGEEVTSAFPGHESRTTWGTMSIDLVSVARVALSGLELSVDVRCTRCGDGLFSHRGGSEKRMAGVAWLP